MTAAAAAAVTTAYGTRGGLKGRGRGGEIIYIH